MKKNLLIIVLGIICGIQFWALHKKQSAHPFKVDWPEEIGVAKEGDKFTGTLEGDTIYLGFDNRYSDVTFKYK